MDFPELACRGRQEAFKWIEGIQPAPRRPQVRNDPDGLERFIENACQRFFHGAFDVPAADPDAIAAADALLRGRFDLLGYRDLNFGDPVDWHLDPISGRRAPLRHWTALDPDDHATIGDTKVICELNRHQWLVRLGQAYRLTRDERYATALVDYLQSWLRANPPGMGINWTSSLELALRLIAWSWALVLISDSAALNPAVFGEVIDSVRAHATHIERYLSYYFSPNTHLTGEALGLLYAGLFFPQLRSAQRWRSLGARVLVQEIERQVLPDGVYFERTTCYQRYTVDTYMQLMILGARAGVEVPAVVHQRVTAMLDFLLSIRNGDGSIPAIGDADGGRLLPLGSAAASDFRSTFSTAAIVFKDPRYAWAAGDIAPETQWLLGRSSAASFAALQPETPPMSDVCRAFPEGGFAVMRSGWDEESHSLILDAGPLGCHYSSGHGHADLLSVQVSAFGEPYIVDPGMSCYGVNRPLRDFFRGTAAHSTVRIDGEDQAKPAGTFSWQSRPSAKLRQWTMTLADAEHDAYRALPDPVSHRRRVIFMNQQFWIVIDDLAGATAHDIEMRFQFAPMQIRIDENGWARATRGGKGGLLTRAFANTPLNTATDVGAHSVRPGRALRAPTVEVREGWIAPDYGQVEPAPALVYTVHAQLPFRIVTILWPSEDVNGETPEVDDLAARALIER